MARLDWYIRANLKPRHWQLLTALDDLRHVGKVAEFLHISQPAVSKALAEIERGLGIALFERGPRGLTPTVYGECMIRLSRSLLKHLDDAGSELRDLQSGATGRVTLGVLPVAAPVLAPRAVMRMQERAPGVVVVIHEATADRLLPMLREGLIDILVGTLPPASMSSGLVEQVLHEGEGAVLVCGKRHPLAGRAQVKTNDLQSFPFVIPPLGTLFRDVVEQLMGELQLPLDLARIESGSMTSTNTVLRETEAISFYAPHLAYHYERLGWLHVLPVPLPRVPVPIGCAWAARTLMSRTMQQLVDTLSEVAREELKV